MSFIPETNADIPPAFGGLITEINSNDVLCGRGGRIAQHAGNLYFRDLVRKHRSTYLSRDTRKSHKAKIASKIVQTIRNLDPPGRFLKEQPKAESTDKSDDSTSCEDDGLFSGMTWLEVGDEKARKKAGQAMREKIDEGKKEKERKQQESMKRSMYNQMAGDAMGLPTTHVASSSFPTTSPTNTMGATSQSWYEAYHNVQESSTLPPAMVNSSTPHAYNMQYVQQHSTNQSMNQTAFPSNYDHSPPGSYLCGNGVATNDSFDSQNHVNSNIVTTTPFCLSEEDNDESMQHNQSSFEPLGYLGEASTGSNVSSWNDSWDQGQNLDNFPLVDTFSKSFVAGTESARRRQFQMMKNESSCLPSFDNVPCFNEEKTENKLHDFNENELMKGSLVSMDMTSSSGLSGEINGKKSLNPTDSPQSGGEMRKSVNMMETTMSMNDIRMDSLMTSLTSLIMSAD